MQQKDIDAAVIMQPRDLFYYSRTSQPCNLVVPARGEPILLVRRGAAFVQQETCLPNFEKGGGPRQILAHLKKCGIQGGQVGLEFDIVPHGLIRRLADTLSAYSLVDISPLILHQRMIKDADEIRYIHKATGRFDTAHETIAAAPAPRHDGN